ncbi:redoxin domain-containing protein [Gramella sp. AN32]|uniref:Redoxin domain-containing protein n=1 Tax=Christiangramia antarctica TaxID=2058158 RepID=A0ABW5X8H3_9FLAO|nr:redoxin domain-containing protein [Gramella sp. AN32]MCM4156062.1 alkyl hydroperoxide reductase [Gramella sp. AN32]
MKNLLPGKEVPNLIIPTTKGIEYNLAESIPENFNLVIFYRGLHCPVCKKYLEELNEEIDDFYDLGVNVICISANNKELALKTVEEWDVPDIHIGYGMSIEEARKWDLYISKGIKESEPEYFFEPALFLVRPDDTLYSASIQSMPFARPKFNELKKSISFVLKNDYPARGES